ncbi:MAG: hypothetical protein ACFFAN_17455 [Promethearchaeota archaeon]
MQIEFVHRLLVEIRHLYAEEGLAVSTTLKKKLLFVKNFLSEYNTFP